MHRTRIKICGITRAEDLSAAVCFGADALGFVFYPPSPRYIETAMAATLVRQVPPFVSRVGLFVNPTVEFVRHTISEVALEMLQFHGDETEQFCCQFGKPYLKAARVRPGIDLLEFARGYPSAQGLLLDAWVEGYGGAGKTFDWSLIPDSLPLPMLLSGGLHAGNVGEAVRKLKPWAVDVSSGVEEAKGIKNADKIAEFVAAVRAADGG